MNEAVAAITIEPTSVGFEEFFLQHRDGLFGALWLVTRDRHEAEEVAQDAFLKVWERWARVSSLEDPVGYLYRTGMNLLRSRRRRVLVALKRTVRLTPADDGFAQVEARDAVVRALRGLTPRERTALVLTDLLQMTSEEAGRVMGARPSTVRVLSARARNGLRERIGDDHA
jgi:RNA polymerase sigma-70 factor, ECF subfamily